MCIHRRRSCSTIVESGTLWYKILCCYRDTAISDKSYFIKIFVLFNSLIKGSFLNVDYTVIILL